MVVKMIFTRNNLKTKITRTKIIKMDKNELIYFFTTNIDRMQNKKDWFIFYLENFFIRVRRGSVEFSDNFSNFILIIYCRPEDLLKWAEDVKGPSSANPAISWGTIEYSSTPVHGLHMHSIGAFVITWN